MTQSGSPNQPLKPGSPLSAEEKRTSDWQGVNEWLGGVGKPEVLKQARHTLKTPENGPLSARWLAVVVPDDGEPSVVATESFAALADFIRDMVGTDVAVYPFYGVRVGITKGEPRWLVHPNGSRLPLFRTDSSQELDETGFLGRSPSFQQDPNAIDMVGFDSEEPDPEDPETEDPEDPEEGGIQWGGR